MEKSMKIIILLIGMASQLAAAPYIEYKNEVELKYDNYVKKFIELGVMSEYGKAGEIGYKFNKDSWTFKGKWELKNHLEHKSKIQTEIRYTFNK